MTRPDDGVASLGNPVLAASWRRSSQSGLIADADVVPTFSEVNLECRMFRAASPVLKRIGEEIHDARLSVMLVDRQARMLATVDGCRETTDVVARIGALPGALWREETTGTNALATPFETRQPLFVNGREHYVDRLKDYSCYGAPIRNPVNGRLEGVLDIMCDAGAESGLMKPFIDGAIAEIQSHMRANLGGRSQAVLRAFEEAARHPALMVVALSRSMVLQSPAAAALLTPTDLARLRELGEGSGAGRTSLELDHGQVASLELEPIGEDDGMLVKIQTRRRPVVPRRAAPVRPVDKRRTWVDQFRRGSGSGVVVGEPGSGRSVVLRQAAQGLPVCRIDPVREEPDDVDSRLEEEIGCSAHELLVIDGAETLSERSRRLLTDALKEHQTRVLAGVRVDSDVADEADIVNVFPSRLDLPALRECRSHFNAIVDEIAGPGVRFRFSPQAQRVLQAYPWPGNLNELSALLEQLAPVRGTVIEAEQLPSHLRARATGKSMTPWQQASYDAILHALEVNHGNKAHAADYLGISRNTLYHHIREYGILA